MTNNLISTSNYLYLVDDSPINNGDYVLNVETKTVFDYIFDYNEKKTSLKKIVAHLPLNENSFHLKKLKLLPPLKMNLMPYGFKYEKDTFGNIIIETDENNRDVLLGKYLF